MELVLELPDGVEVDGPTSADVRGLFDSNIERPWEASLSPFSSLPPTAILLAPSEGGYILGLHLPNGRFFLAGEEEDTARIATFAFQTEKRVRKDIYLVRKEAERALLYFLQNQACLPSERWFSENEAIC